MCIRDRGTSPDNPDQRIQEDLNLFTSYSVSLSMGLLNALVTLASFVGILWGLSGAFDFKFNGASYEIPGFMVWMAVLYCAVGSVLTHYIGRPLIGLNFEQQKREADYRHHLVRVREYSESIALDHGEAVEEKNLDTRFSAVLSNYLRLIGKQKQLVGFTNLFGQAATVFPFIIAAPRFFSGAIQLGELMQIGNAFDRVQASLSWFVDNYDSLAAWRATTERLTSFEAVLSKSVQAAPGDAVGLATGDANAIEALGLTLLYSAASQALWLSRGSPVLGLGALHALSMGFLGSVMIAMVTRVSCGHSGRPLVADKLVWALFWLLQITVGLRLIAAVQGVPAWLTGLVALLWAVVVTAWTLRYASWYGRPRIDGKPG